MTDITEIPWALNGYRSAVRSAEGYVSGKLVYNRRFTEKRLRDLLWEHRETIAELIKKNPTAP